MKEKILNINRHVWNVNKPHLPCSQNSIMLHCLCFYGLSFPSQQCLLHYTVGAYITIIDQIDVLGIYEFFFGLKGP